jgi:hypothetical protein
LFMVCQGQHGQGRPCRVRSTRTVVAVSLAVPLQELSLRYLPLEASLR